MSINGQSPSGGKFGNEMDIFWEQNPISCHLICKSYSMTASIQTRTASLALSAAASKQRRQAELKVVPCFVSLQAGKASPTVAKRFYVPLKLTKYFYCYYLLTLFLLLRVLS